MTLPIHAIAGLFPEMSPDEYAALKADIQANGLREPIWLHEGRVIDGRHRARACHELGIRPATRNWSGTGSLTAFVVSLNIHRRSLTSSQRAAIAVDVAEMLEEEAKARQKAGASKGGQAKPKGESKVPQKVEEPCRKSNGEAAEMAAKIVGTNRQYVHDAKKLKAEAPELHAKVASGEKKLTEAKSELRKREKLAELEQKAKEKQFEAAQPIWTLINQDVVDGLLSVVDHHSRPRLIVTDPPYNIGVDYGDGAKADKKTHLEYMLWVGDWLNACYELLSPDGSIWIIINDEYAAEYVVTLRKIGFSMRSWVKWYETFGVNCQRSFNRTSRHILYFVKSTKDFVFNESAVSRPSDRQVKYNDKRAAEGGKILDDVWTDIPRLTGTCEERIPSFPTQLPVALIRRIIECASDPGDLVIDPFNGSGTTGAACLTSQPGPRKYIGIDKSEAFINIADKRLKVLS